MAFPSVYDMTNASMTTVRNQHFWEYFSGSNLQNSPTFRDDFSTDNWADSTSGLIRVQSDSLYCQWRRAGASSSSSSQYDLGAGNVSNDSWVLRYEMVHNTLTNNNSYLITTLCDTPASGSNPASTTGADFIGFHLAHGSSQKWVATTVGDNTSFIGGAITNSTVSWATGTRYYVELKRTSASGTNNVTVTVWTGGYNGTLFGTVTATAASTVDNLRYITVYNQNFAAASDVKDTNIYNMKFYNGTPTANGRWTTNDVIGTNTFAMKDAVDGGFQITTGGTSGDNGTITFNDIRQYAHNGSTIIGVLKFDETTIDGAFGLSNSSTLGSSHSVLWSESIESNFKLSTSGTGSRTETDTSVARDTATRTVKIVNGSSDVNMYFDNVLVSTISAPNPIPNASMQPIFYLKTQSAATKTGHITYCEAYNT